MENFDELSNEELRLKLLEYGFANMPVTVTTRKVLVRKLKNHVEGAKAKVRRDTIQITKYSSDEDSSKEVETQPKKKEVTNRRATIGGDKLSKTLPAAPPPTQLPKPESKTRRSGRITPLAEKAAASIAAGPTEPDILEDSDNEILSTIPLSLKKGRKSKSKSPSLSKGDTITTSYVQHTEMAKESIIMEDVEMDDGDDDDVMLVDDLEEEEPFPATQREYAAKLSSAGSGITRKRTTIAPSFPATTISSYYMPTVEPLSSKTTLGISRPSLSTSYNYSTVLRKDDVKLDPSDSPYLSEFTRRLSRLKTDQFSNEAASPRRATIAPTSTTKDYYRPATSPYMGPLARKSNNTAAAHANPGIRESLQAVMIALERNYPVKTIMYFLCILLIVIFVFVFFFM